MKLKFNPLEILGHATDLTALTKIEPTLPTIKLEPTLPTSNIDLGTPSKVDATTTADATTQAPASLITSSPLSSRDTDDEEPTSPVRTSTRRTADDEDETSTQRTTATSDDDESPRTTKTSDVDESMTTKATSRTPTIDSLLPTTLMTKTSSTSSFDFPYPTSVLKSNDNSTEPKRLTELEKTQADLEKYKIHYRNMIIALTMFALLVVGFVAFKIWWTCFRVKKKVATMGVKTVLEGGRGWFGAMKKGKEAYEMHKAKKAGSAPGGADYI